MSARLALLLVAGLDAALAAAIWNVARTPLEIAPVAPPQRIPPPAETAAETEGAAIDLQALQRNHVLARPLFAETRRAWQPPPPAPVVAPLVLAPPQAVEAAAPRLVGIGITGGRARALLADPEGIETLWVGIGETAWTWRVREIEAGLVTVEQDSRVVPLSLYPDREGG